MTVKELMDALSDCLPDAQVEAATQPSYPMRAEFLGVVQHGRKVWLAVGDHIDYDVPQGVHGAAARQGSW